MRSRRRHKSILNIAKMAQMPTNLLHDLQYFRTDSGAQKGASSESIRCTKIVQDSLRVLEHKLSAPFNPERELLQYGFIAGVCHDMRLQAVMFHEELLRILSRIPEMRGKTNTMTLQSVFAYLSHSFPHTFGHSRRAYDLGKEENKALSAQSANSGSQSNSKTISALLKEPESPHRRRKVGISLPAERRDTLGKSMSVAEKIVYLQRLHDMVRYGPARMCISKEEWMFYSEGMEEVVQNVRSCIKV
ncbi:hypothetical protein XU18_1355 [Perkinsela sp. CCAP 1560/4]|nr:hypothetical protein XU18_1355 [Perkinsela sp. CCAP 1560/4]|eukprot:KNH08025.1 hypothetical protein XU18_1355 [Perkinsela sp. CCAP 1560/4]